MFEFNIINGSSETITQNTIFLIDTNVLSELMRERPNQGVIDFFSTDLKMMISAVTIQELFFGYENIPNTMVAKKEKIIIFINTALKSFETKIAPVTIHEAKIAGQLQGFQKQNGRNISHFNATIAGTCLYLGAVLVTRNVKDFEYLDIPILNPFI
jgi:toxin FitB